MARKLDHEKVAGTKRIQRNGAIWTNATELTQKERNALEEGRQRARQKVRKRQEEHKCSLIENLQPDDPQEALRQLSGIKEIYQSLSKECQATQGKWMLNKIMELESLLGTPNPRKAKKD